MNTCSGTASRQLSGTSMRAEPRAGVEQHQIVGMIGGEDRDAVAAPDAELATSARAPPARCVAPSAA